ncbi:NucA/NucB deoxyribonuclease domain-containing protein [Streptomyces sp. NPDC054796]
MSLHAWLRSRPRPRTLIVGAAAAVLIPVSAPAAAGADGQEQLRMESTVLPVGAQAPSLGELQADPSGARARLAELAQRGVAQGARETVGPAAGYGVLAEGESATPSQTAAALGPESGTQTFAVDPPYPEPGRSMTTQECFEALNGTGAKFYIKSRFAVCSGASFTQTWFKNNKPVGESQFVLVAKSTIAKSSRAVNVEYDYLRLEQTGSTGTSGLMIGPDATLPQVWPSSATVRQSGSIPAPRSWAAVKADPDPSFTHTLTVDAGQGSGKDDTVFAVYQPKVTLKAPAGWKMGGDLSGEPFFLAPRWDTAPYLGRKGAAVMSYLVSMPFSTKAGALEKQAAEHIEDAFTSPGSTMPKNAAKDIPGRTSSRPLSRLYYDTDRRDANRNQAIKTCKESWGEDYAEDGKYECDEFPFSSTYEGAAQALPKYDPQGKAPKNNYSARPILTADNNRGGKIIQGFYQKNRIIDGPDDGFTVSVS